MQVDDARAALSAPQSSAAGLATEAILEPARRIIDAHHHFWDHPANPATGMPARRYLIHEMEADAATGHNLVATVHVEGGGSMHSVHAPDHLKPVGETEFASGIAAMSDSGHYGPARMCLGIVGAADLDCERVEETLDAHIAAGGGRFRGIRDIGTWDSDESIRRGTRRPARYRYAHPDFRRGFALLAPRRLSFDAWLYHPQLDDALGLARDFPDTTVIVDHCGGPVRIGAYADDLKASFDDWRAAIARLAAADNVSIKVGGLGMFLTGLNLDKRPDRIGSEELAELLRPMVEACIESFGPRRCMFESNFPVDRLSFDYAVVWNAFKRLAAGLSEDEKDAMFFGNANRAYRLGL